MLMGGRKRSGPGGGHADEARKAHGFLMLAVGCGCAAVPGKGLAAPLKPPALSACQLLSMLGLPTEAPWAGGDAGVQVWWDGELPAGDVPHMQHLRAGFWSHGCQLWSLGSFSPLPQHLLVSEHQVRIYF